MALDHTRHRIWCGQRISGSACWHDGIRIHTGGGHFHGCDPCHYEEELHSGEQHRADHRFCGRVAGGRRHLYHAGPVFVGGRGAVRYAEPCGDHADRAVRRYLSSLWTASRSSRRISRRSLSRLKENWAWKYTRRFWAWATLWDRRSPLICSSVLW